MWGIIPLSNGWAVRSSGRQLSMRKRSFITLALLALALVTSAVHARHHSTMTTSDQDSDQASYSIYLPSVFGSPPAPRYDMTRFMIGDGRLYEVMHSSNSQARHQTQLGGGHFYHTKGNEVKAEWEELWVRGGFIYRGTDTSPGNGRFYTLYAGHEPGTIAGSAWSPRHWRVGEVYERNPYVVFYQKSDCSVVPNGSGFQRSWLRFEAYYPTYTFQSGLRLANVIELSWLLKLDGEPEESYFYAESYGLVGWGSADRGYSYVNEIHAPGQRPDNQREVIGCLNRASTRLRSSPLLNFGPLPEGFRAK